MSEVSPAHQPRSVVQPALSRVIGAFVGLVPSEHSSGASRAQGPDTQDR